MLAAGSEDPPVTSMTTLFPSNAIELPAWPPETAVLRITCDPLCASIPSAIPVEVPPCSKTAACLPETVPLERWMAVAELAQTLTTPPISIYTWWRIAAMAVVSSAGHVLIAMNQSRKFYCN
jgi:hypothetical protein